jgi:hypothetical protein
MNNHPTRMRNRVWSNENMAFRNQGFVIAGINGMGPIGPQYPFFSDLICPWDSMRDILHRITKPSTHGNDNREWSMETMKSL